MIIQGNDKYKYWLENPIEIDDPEEDINKNLLDGPGYIIRDYRFYPKLIPANLDSYKVKDGIRRCPSRLQLFYAWELHNEQQALRDNKKYEKYRKKSIKRMESKRFKRMYIKRRKLYYIYDDIIRKDCIEFIDKILDADKNDDLISDTMKFYILIGNLNLIISDYDESIYKEFIENLLSLIYYIFIIKINKSNDIFNLMTRKGVDLKRYRMGGINPHKIFDKLIVINKILNSMNLR